MKKFKQSLCSVSIALALSASASTFAEEERKNDHQITASITNVFAQNEAASAPGDINVARIGQGLLWGVSEGNDSSISISGMGSFYTKYLGQVSAEILVDGTDNVSSIEQINTVAHFDIGDTCCSNYAWAYTTSATDSAAANNTGNTNTIIQVGGDNRAASEIQVGSYNSVSVYQDGFNPNYAWTGQHLNANQAYLHVNGDYNSLDVTSIAEGVNPINIVAFDITGDNNTATINVNSSGAYFGYNPDNTSKISHFTGNNNTLVADLNDEGISDTYVEFTGDNNTVSIITEGNSTGFYADAHQIKMGNVKGDGNTFDIESYGSAANHVLANLTGDDNSITVKNLAGYNNRTIVNNLTGNRNTIDITIDGEGGDNGTNVGKNAGDDNTTTVVMTGYQNNVARIMADGNNNTTIATISGSENIAKFSAPDNLFSPGFVPSSGSDNEMVITQDGERNEAYYMDAGDGRFYETTQIGDDNFSLVRGTGNEKYVTVYQEGDLNYSSIVYNREQAKNGNITALKSIEVAQLGDMNNIELDLTASSDITVDQTGSYNDVQLMVIHSDDAYAAEATRHYISQIGSGNIVESEVNSAKWSKQHYNQTGSDNYIYWNEGGGIQNHSFIDQTGAFNTAYVTLGAITWTTITKVDIDQTGAFNEVDMDITGNRNGDSQYSGYDAGIVVQQMGDDNLVVGTDGFGFTIAGDSNSLMINQVGNGNTAAGFIVGNSNNAQIHQIGNDNFASINISGY